LFPCFFELKNHDFGVVSTPQGARRFQARKTVSCATKHTLLFSGENRKSVPDGLGSAQGGKPAVRRPDSTPFPFGHLLLRCKVTVIYNAVK